MDLLFRLLRFAVVFILGAAPLLKAQDVWEWRSPTPTGNRLGSFAYGQNQFVGVGEMGEIATSPDGITWTLRESGITDPITRVIFDGTCFIAVSTTSILSSTNGIAWTKLTAPAPVWDLAYGNGHYVAIAGTYGSQQFLTSSDGIVWTLQSKLAVSPNRVVFANGIFVAADLTGAVLTSVGGINWTSVQIRPALQGYQVALAAGNNHFLVSWGGSLYLSADGLAWKNVSTANPAQEGPYIGLNGKLGFAGGYFFVDEGHEGRGIFRSADGETWPVPKYGSVEYYQNNAVDLSTIAFGGDTFIASAATAFSGTGNRIKFTLYSSANGLSWTNRSEFTLTTFRAPIYGLGRFFVGDQFSSDGLIWTKGGISPTHAAGNFVFQIAQSYGNPDSVRISADGVTSSLVDPSMAHPRAVAFGKDLYVLVGDDGKISSSPDALTWTARVSGTTRALNTVAFVQNHFVATGAGNTLLTSAEGITWTLQTPAALADVEFLSLVPGPDRVYAGIKLINSSAKPAPLTIDGVQLSFIYPEDRFSTALFNGVFVALSFAPATPEIPYSLFPKVWKSSDGAAWTEVPLHLGSTNYNNSARPGLVIGNNSALLVANPGNPSYPEDFPILLQTPQVVSVPPAVSSPPVSTSVARGETAYFSVGASGSGPFTFQWLRNGSPIEGATSQLLQIIGTTDNDAADYTVRVTSSAGTATSSAAHLTITRPVPLTITTQPVGGTVYAYQTFVFSVSVTGSGPITYQWRRNGTPIFGATLATYSIWSPDYLDPSGTYDVVVTAPYSTVTSQTAVLTRGGPSVTTNPSGSLTLTAGDTLKITATAIGNGPFTYWWRKPGVNNTLARSSNPTLTLPYLTATDSSPYSVEVTDANGHTASASLNVWVTAASTPPITPAPAAFDSGASISLRAGVSDSWNYRFQWRRGGVPIAGATSVVYSIENFSASDEGDYEVQITAPDGTVTTRAIGTLVLDSARLVNLSARAVAGTGEDTMIVGFVLNGTPSTESPDVLVRSIGPTLIGMGVNGTLADPAIRVVDRSASLIAENDNWSTALPTGRGIAATAADMAHFGAFALSSGSHDSAVLVHETPPGSYTALVSAVSGGTGIVLNEIYGPTSGSQRLVNLSARARVTNGDSILIAGFVIAGHSPRKVLIRGVGPTLSGQGIAQPLNNPVINLHNVAGQVIHNNDNWGQAANVADIRTAGTATGAFPLNEGSHDAAMLETLNPGVYTVHVTSADGTSGVALVEIYEVR